MDPNLSATYQMEQMAALRGMHLPLVSAANFDPTKMKAVDFRTENMQLLEQQAQQQSGVGGETSQQRSILEMSAMPLQVSYEQYQQLSSAMPCLNPAGLFSYQFSGNAIFIGNALPTNSYVNGPQSLYGATNYAAANAAGQSSYYTLTNTAFVPQELNYLGNE